MTQKWSLARSAGLFAVLIGSLVLAGWLARVQALTSFGGLRAMNPTTAVGIVATGAALALLADGSPPAWRRWVGWALASSAIFLGSVKLGGYLTGWDVGIDRLLFETRLYDAPGGPVRLAPNTAVDLILSGLALLALDLRHGRYWRPAELLAFAAIVVAFPPLVGHLSRTVVLTQAGSTFSMSLPGALGFLVLGAGIVTARSTQGLFAFSEEASLRSQVNLGFGVAAVILVLMGSISVWTSLRSQQAASERFSSTGRREQLEHLMGALQDAETGQRGYLLTGKPGYLAPYEAVVDSFPERLRSLRAAMVPYPPQSARLDVLDSLVQGKLALLAQTIGLRRQGRAAAAVAIVESGRGKVIMDRARDVVTAMVKDEQLVIEVWDVRLRRADQLSVFTNSAGAVLTVVFLMLGAKAINRNVAGRERAEEALRESEQRLVQLIEAMPVAVYVLDGNGKPFYANRASQAILGHVIDPALSAGDLAEAYSVYRVGSDHILPGDQQPIVRALAGESVYVEDLELRRPDRVVPLEVWAAPVRDASGRVIFAVAVFSDITQRRQDQVAIRDLNAQLNARVAELVDLNQELEAFTYSVSHDLRAPVRHVDGFARLLEETLGPGIDPQIRHYLGWIREGARTMGHLIDDLLQLSRVSRQDLAVQRVDLNALLRNVVFDLRDETKGRDIDWRIGRLPGCECDAGLVKVVMTNLLANALKFTRTRARAVIEVGQMTADGELAFFVRDNGVGFDRKYADRLFGVFQRLHRPEDFEGTGVGLATVQRIVHKHGGLAWAEAEPDKGATFYFTLRERGSA